jgi:hypothetical protein
MVNQLKLIITEAFFKVIDVVRGQKRNVFACPQKTL